MGPTDLKATPSSAGRAQAPTRDAGASPSTAGSVTTLGATPARPQEGERAGTSGPERLYPAVYESMSCGVMLVGADGCIEMFNPAASRLLGLDRKAVLHRSFAEVFVADAAFDEFNEAVLAAIYEGNVGRQRVANVTVGGTGATVPLSVETAYLRDSGGGGDAGRAVVAVFSDISELERLRAKEVELAGDLRTRHTELRNAYRSLEERNRALDALLRRRRAVRVVASAALLALVVGIGAWQWSEPAAWFGAPPPPAPGGRLYTVEPRRIVSTLTVTSAIRPRRDVAITSPVEGRVAVVHVVPGQRVAAGQPLLDLDTAEVRIRHRAARAVWLKAKTQAATLADWPSSVEVSKARRAMTKARLALEAGNTQLAEISFLVERGLTPAVRQQAAEREQRTRRLDLEAAEQDLNVVLAKGREDAEVARLKLANAAADLERLDRMLRDAAVAAPVAGVVLRLGAGSGRSGDALVAGAPVEPGGHLVTIGDMEGVTTSGRVDEVDVRRIRPGHPVRITGPAFPDITLAGRIVHVSSQASRPSGAARLPAFEIAAVVDALSAEQRAAVRLGMSAAMEIVVHEDDHALVVPVRAVDLSAGRARVRVRDAATGATRLVEVTTGVTTADSVEIRGGLARGDTVVVP